MKEEVSHGAVHACALLQAEMPLLRFCFLGGAGSMDACLCHRHAARGCPCTESPGPTANFDGVPGGRDTLRAAGGGIAAAVSLGVNRLSLGMQAAQAPLLRTLGRIHTLEQVREAVDLARQAGVKNLSLDLMFGLPGQTLADWAETLEAALDLAPEHLSCYGLIPEEGTPLGEAIHRGEVTLPSEEEERAMYDMALQRLHQAGFMQYEISNFARPGYACAHNLGYWRQVPYLGLGVGAASMLPGRQSGEAYRRRTNVRDLASYLRQGETGNFAPAEAESITPAEACFETMMLGLRTREGVSERAFMAMHGISLEQMYGQRLTALASRGLMEKHGEWWRLTRRGMDVQNAVLVELMEE